MSGDIDRQLLQNILQGASQLKLEHNTEYVYCLLNPDIFTTIGPPLPCDVKSSTIGNKVSKLNRYLVK